MKQEVPPDLTVRVVHVSDLHISEQLISSTTNQVKAPHLESIPHRQSPPQPPASEEQATNDRHPYQMNIRCPTYQNETNLPCHPVRPLQGLPLLDFLSRDGTGLITKEDKMQEWPHTSLDN